MEPFKTLFSQLPKGSISDIIVKRITNALINGELKPGDKIPTEQEFSKRLGIGRNAVREAIKVLVAFGVLEIRRSEGTFVVDQFTQNLLNPLVYGLILSNKSMEDLLMFKIGLLNSSLYLAIKNASPKDIAHLKERCRAFETAMLNENEDITHIYDTSAEYHHVLGQIVGNPMMQQLNEMSLKIANYTRIKAIEVSIERGKRHLLPDSYKKDVDLIESHDAEGLSKHMDEKYELWKWLLL